MLRTAIAGIASVLAISAATLAQDSVQPGEQSSEQSAAPAPALEEMRHRALSLVNDARKQHGLEPLQSGERLDKAAQAHAEDMLARGYYSHVSPDGETVEDRYRDQGGSRWKRVAENIATCKECKMPATLDRVARFHEGWMKSPGHRENILMRGVQNFGFGVAGKDGRVYAVQTFAGPGMPLDLADGEEPVALSTDEQMQRAVQAINRAREREGLDPLEHSAVLSEVAKKLIPENGTGDHLIDRPDDLFALLPGDTGLSWRRLQVMAAACGGCGTQPTAADIRYFADQWTNNPNDRPYVLQSAASHMGFAMQADGEGRKTAVTVLGERRAD
ncbi:CAP domain-containing protein [Dongia deserti]|uniref:CAP domain-containing protein n=1 Tax=Dongia deserti TaxID=2268030 RepID=UPI000E65C7EA|nr:CAP domain-containing protein [Dongia deserti]